MGPVRTKRIYEPPAPDDGRRILVDRLWPRGVAKAAAELDAWLPEVGPSTVLRRWFAHDPDRWDEFRANYHAELDENPALADLVAHVEAGPVTLLYSARDTAHNQAVALAEYLTDR